MKYTEHMKKILFSKNSGNPCCHKAFSPLLAVSLMAAGGGVSIAISHSYMLQPAAAQAVATEEPATKVVMEATDQPSESPPAEKEFIPLPDQFNLALCFPEGADISNPLESLGGSAYKELSDMESEWLGNIYNFSGMTPKAAASRLGLSRQSVMGKYNRNDNAQKADDPSSWAIPSWGKINMNISNGDGGRLSGDSNLKEILSLANVYTYHHNYEDKDAFLQYAKELWQDSHSYTISISDVYYCDGCMDNQEDYEESEYEDYEDGTESQNGQTVNDSPSLFNATPSETDFGPGYYIGAASSENQTVSTSSEIEGGSYESGGTGLQEEISCPGHVDLNISIRINGLDEKKNNLYSLDKTGNTPDDSWPGWTGDMKNYVTALRERDWFEQYQISISNISPGKSMGTEDINRYMSQLPEGTSQIRRDLIHFALGSVGKVPYYWGGKPSARGYTGNLFGSITTPDKKGRVRKGLDCSGWISWVYWSVTGQHLPYESTAGLINCGTEIQPEQLQPGDILIRRGEEGHVVMFLGWGNSGNILCIHESSAPANNVIVGEKSLNWQSYRKLIE